MEQMIEQPQPTEGDEATTGTMSPLAAVHQYLSTNSAKSTFLRNSGLVVKVTSSKSPTEQNLCNIPNFQFGMLYIRSSCISYFILHFG
jgi:hypothetical protein